MMMTPITSSKHNHSPPGRTLYMVDAYGRPVLQDTYTGDGHLLQVGHLAPGMYFIRIQNREGNYQLSRVMVAR